MLSKYHVVLFVIAGYIYLSLGGCNPSDPSPFKLIYSRDSLYCTIADTISSSSGCRKLDSLEFTENVEYNLRITFDFISTRQTSSGGYYITYYDTSHIGGITTTAIKYFIVDNPTPNVLRSFSKDVYLPVIQNAPPSIRYRVMFEASMENTGLPEDYALLKNVRVYCY